MLSRILAAVTLVAFVLLSIILQVTSPSSIPPIGILFVFVLFYVIALGVLTFFMYWFSRLLIMLRRRPAANSNPMSLRDSYYFASVVALAPVLLIAMRSIGRGGFGDFILVVAFELFACLYVAKRR